MTILVNPIVSDVMVCFAYTNRDVCWKYEKGIVWVNKGKVAYQCAGGAGLRLDEHRLTEWHGRFVTDAYSRVTISFDCKGRESGCQYVFLLPTGHGEWTGRDAQLRDITLRHLDTYVMHSGRSYWQRVVRLAD